MNKLTKRIKTEIDPNIKSRFEKFNLQENPFPSEPVVNKDSTDKRINGGIYEFEIRRNEYEQIEKNFLIPPQNDPNHLRMGLLIDSSYIGRGNGKSAFLIHLQNMINENYCLDISNDINKCFALYISPEPGGRTKSFMSFVDLLAFNLFESNIIRDCLTVVRLDALLEQDKKFNIKHKFKSEVELVESLNDENWFLNNKIDLFDLNKIIQHNKYISQLPPSFPIFSQPGFFNQTLVTEKDFKQYYFTILKKGKERIEFIFNHLVNFFLAAGFNGAYLLVDDFERIPDFQSARQKKDFSLELRSCLYDGYYLNSKIGFFNMFLVFHAGVQRLISEAWSEAGMENRVPITPTQASKHIVVFDKLNIKHVKLLLRKYIDEYRIKPQKGKELHPFSEEAVNKISEISEYNASKILKLAYNLLDKAAETPDQNEIDLKFVTSHKETFEPEFGRTSSSIDQVDSVDLEKKSKGTK